MHFTTILLTISLSLTSLTTAAPIPFNLAALREAEEISNDALVSAQFLREEMVKTLKKWRTRNAQIKKAAEEAQENAFRTAIAMEHHETGKTEANKVTLEAYKEKFGKIRKDTHEATDRTDYYYAALKNWGIKEFLEQ